MNSAEVLIKFKGDTSDLDKSTASATSSLGKLTKAFTLGNLAAKGISKGIEVFTANLDGAISRFDTLNNFPKVMSNLGISTKDSEKAINYLSDKLKGLPTSLDSAALSVQRFTSKNGDVKKSADLFLAVNNAILAGGASPQIQSAALEQLSQAYAKGKPDMMEWRSIQTAMPAQLKQVAKAMGYADAATLGEAVRAKDGEKEFARMMDTMMRMNTEGVAGFKSFEEQSKNATGGINTSITNMKTAFVRGIADMITQIDKSLKPFGGLSGVINSVGKVGEKVFKKLGSILSVIIPKFIEFAKWVNKNKVAIEVAAGVLVSFIAVFKTAKTISNITSKVKDFSDKVSKIKKTAQEAGKSISTFKGVLQAMNLTFLSSPVFWVIAGIVALVAAIVILYNKCEGFRNFINGWIEGFKIMLSGIVGFIKKQINMIKTIFDAVVKFITSQITLTVDIIKATIDTAINIFKTVFITIPTWIYNTVIKPIANFFGNMWNNFKNGAVNAWNGIKSVFGTVASFFKNVFTNAWSAVKAVFSTGGKIFTGIKDGIVKAFKTIVNGIIGGINRVVKVPFDGINGVLKKIKNISIAGKKPFAGLVHTVSVPQIPKLSVGTNKVPEDMLAMIHEGEAVVPKKFNPYANGMNNSMLGIMNNNKGNQVINVYASFKQDNLGQMVRDIKTFSGGARNDFNYGSGA